MAGYQRKTALAPHEVFEKAGQVLPELLAGMKRSAGSDHSATYVGPEGSLQLTAHRHGPYTSVVARTWSTGYLMSTRVQSLETTTLFFAGSQRWTL